MTYELTENMKENIKTAIMIRLDSALYTSDWDTDDWASIPSFNDIEDSIKTLYVLGYTEVAEDYLKDYKEKRGI